MNFEQFFFFNEFVLTRIITPLLCDYNFFLIKEISITNISDIYNLFNKTYDQVHLTVYFKIIESIFEIKYKLKK